MIATPLAFVIFDLDNTLYQRGSGVMEGIGHRIQLWLCRELDLTWEEARTLRRTYLRQHGSTMGGLLADHLFDVSDYLEFVHDIPIEEHLDPDLELQAMLERIPLRKVIHTNATSTHARRVLRALGVEEAFEAIIGIEEVGLNNKFSRRAYQRMLDLLEAEGTACVMVEDSPRNLPPAKALGMMTILVDRDLENERRRMTGESIDFVVGSILEVEQVLDRLVGGNGDGFSSGDRTRANGS